MTEPEASSAPAPAPAPAPGGEESLRCARAASTFYAFGSPAYRILWTNATLMRTAVHLSFTAHSVVAFEITGKNSSVGLASFAIGSALLLTTPLSGAIADRVSKRLLLACTQLLLVVMAVGVAGLLYADALTIGLLAGAGFLFGTAISFFWPAITACMGDVVDADRQANGASLFQISLNFTRSFVPFVGGGLLAWHDIGFGGTYVVVALILAPTLISIAFIPRAQPPSARSARQGPMLTDVRLGAQHVLQNQPLRHAMTSFIVVILMGYSIIVVLPAFSKDVLGGGEAGFGIMFGVHAIGGLIAGLLVASRSQSPKLGTYLMLSSVSLGLSISVMAFMPSFAAGLLAIGAVGAAAGAFQTLVMAAILRASKPEYYGRVMALTNVGWALNNLFGLALGILADATTERTALAGLGLLLACVSLLLARWSSSRQSPRVSDVPAA